MKKIIYLTLALFAFVSCNKQNEIQHTFYGAVLGQTKEQVCDSLDKNHITYDEWSMSYLDYDYLEIKQPELAGYAFTESTFEIDRETMINDKISRLDLDNVSHDLVCDFTDKNWLSEISKL